APGFWVYAPGADQQLHLRLIELHRGLLWSIVQRSALARYLFINMRLSRRVFEFAWPRSLVVGDPGSEAPRYAGNTEAAADTARIDTSLAAMDAFFRDLSDLVGLPPDRVAFTMDGFRYPAAATQGAGTYFDRMRREFQARAAARGYEVIDMDPWFFAHFRQHAQPFDFPRDGHWNPIAHGIAAQAVLSSRLMARLLHEAK